MYDLQNLCIGYRNGASVRHVADGITARLASGQLTCLLGPNGVGKSTLLRTLTAFQKPLGGKILISRDLSLSGSSGISDAVDLCSLTPRQLSCTIAVVLTEKPDIHNMTVYELVAMGRSPYTDFWGRLSSSDAAIVSEAIQTVGIEKLSRRMIDTLSDGERQKVMIAKALAQQTPLILLDEPTAFLDYPSKVETMLLLRRICRETGKTVLLSTHDLELALQTADGVWLMEPGGQLHVGTPRQLAALGHLSRFIERPNVAFNPETLTITVK